MMLFFCDLKSHIAIKVGRVSENIQHVHTSLDGVGVYENAPVDTMDAFYSFMHTGFATVSNQMI